WVLVLGAALAGWFARSGVDRAAQPGIRFREPEPGRRSPVQEAFGFRVGRTTLAQAKARLSALGIACRDASPGGSVDVVSAASRTRHDVAQVRLACEDVRATSIGDRMRSPALGRLLLIFDDTTRPLRHVSFDRVRSDPQQALADFEDTLRAFSKIHGAPAARSQRFGTSSPAALEKLAPVWATFNYSDLLAKVSILNMGRRGILVSEIVEVPWPVRADAPTLR
ncbi:MAG TPA: hypothetical protein VK524_14840, partial [Polyangiaceae bacterium]|nr:hypothetical protein [Polyangiaceae bacterium]